MNFRFVNPHNVRWFVPEWAMNPFDLAVALDGLIAEHVQLTRRKPRWDQSLGFWVVCNRSAEGWRLDLRTVDDEGRGADNLDQLFIETDEWVINLSLPEMIKGATAAENTHCVYHHHFEADVPAGYFGITKQRWFDRYAQHLSSARTGSPYLFHRSIRENGHKRGYHRVVFSIIDQERAYALEEEFVALGTLYPLGLNMIPGGLAGIRYLHNLGVRPSSPEARDAAVRDLLTRETVDGRSNPLCAARWESDPDYVARVICGHSGRLTTEQVRSIRLMSIAGRPAEMIATILGDQERRVRAVLTGKRYGRVK